MARGRFGALLPYRMALSSTTLRQLLAHLPMKRTVVRLEHRVKVRIRRLGRSTKDAGVAMRCQIILHAAKGRSSRVIAQGVEFHRSWVSRVIQRFLQYGESARMDQREDNGERQLDEWYLGQLHEVFRADRPTAANDARRGRANFW